MDIARRLALLALLFAVSASADALTRSENWEACGDLVSAAQETCDSSNPECPSHCIEEPHATDPDMAYATCKRYNGDGCGAHGPYTIADHGCSAGGGGFSGSFAAGAADANGEFCDADACLYEQSSDVGIEIGGRFAADFEQTGTPCTPGGADPDPDDDFCFDVGGGYQQCKSDDGTKVCVRTPTGKEFCWTPSESQPQVDGNEAADKSPTVQPPASDPDNTPFEETSRTDSVVNDVPTVIATYQGNEPQPDEDEDEDGDPNDEDPDDDGDGVPDEEDEEEEERTAALTDCSSQPSCSGDPIDCAHYITNWRNYCKGSTDSTSGGATCAAPPTCTSTANPIQCAQLNQLWRVRCDSDASVLGGGSCASAPSCTGDVVGCAAVQQAWKLQCAMNGTVTGEACTSPPTCTGSPILCATHKEAWSERCAREARAASGTGCGSPPTCTGDAIDCKSMQLAWTTSCKTAETTTAVEAGNDILGDIRDGLDDLAGATAAGGETCESAPTCSPAESAECVTLEQTWRARCEGGGGEEEEGPPEGDLTGVFEEETGAVDTILDATGFLTDRSCPVFAPVQVFDATLDFNADGAWCDVLLLLRAIVMAGAYFIAFKVLMGGK